MCIALLMEDAQTHSIYEELRGLGSLRPAAEFLGPLESSLNFYRPQTHISTNRRRRRRRGDMPTTFELLHSKRRRGGCGGRHGDGPGSRLTRSLSASNVYT